MRVRLTVAYDGTHYCGWQVQPNGITIEEVLNRALSDLLGEKITVIGASRTDSGVHALGNIAVFDTDSKIPAEKMSYGLNQRLPDDVVIQKSEQVADDFHPRYQETEKIYEYKIWNTTFPNPLNRLHSYFYYRPLDIVRMQQAASLLIGEHDFQSFCAANAQVLTTVRTIYSCEIRKEGDLILIRVRGNGFLYNMVRIIAGTLIEVGSGMREPESISEILDLKDRKKAGPTAPPHGLTLVKIIYKNEENYLQNS